MIRRALERRTSTLANPAPWLLSAFGAEKTASGVAVTPDKALTVSAWFAGVRVLAESVASLPCLTYRRKAKGERGKDRDPDHHLYELLHDQPNPEHTAFEFWEFVVASLVQRGNAYAIKRMNSFGQTKELWPVRPDQMSVTREAGKLVYVWRPSQSGEQRFTWDSVFHIRGLSSDGVVGLSPVTLMRESLGLSLATQEHGARLFSNGVRPSGFFQHPSNMSDPAQKRFAQSVQAFRGLQNFHRPMIIEEGMKWQDVGFSPEDAQMLESRRFQVEEVARCLRIPPHLLQEMSHATFANIEHQSQGFVIHSLRPWLVRIEHAIRRDVYTDSERRTHKTEFLVDGLLRGDTATRSARYASAIQNAEMSPNEVRGLEGLNPYEGGDQYFVQGNLVPVEMAGQFVTGPTGGLQEGRQIDVEVVDPPAQLPEVEVRTRQALAAGFRPLFAEAIGRVMKAEAREVEKAARKHLSERSADTFASWLGEHYAEDSDFRQWVAKTVAPAYAALIHSTNLRAAGEMSAKPFSDEELAEIAAKYAQGFATRHSIRSKGVLLKVLRESGHEMLPAILAHFEEELENDKAEGLAARETVQTSRAAARETYRGAGVRRLRWVNTGSDTCPYCTRLGGKIVGIDDAFASNGDVLDADGERPLKIRRARFHPPIHPGCDCDIAPA